VRTFFRTYPVRIFNRNVAKCDGVTEEENGIFVFVSH
jgi:hypothetical protein